MGTSGKEPGRPPPRGHAQAADGQSHDTAADLVKQIQAALEASGTGTFVWYLESNRIEWGAAHEKLLEIQLQTDGHTFNDFFQRIHPEDRPRIAASTQGRVEPGESVEMEYRVVLGDGSTRWLWTRGRVVAEPGGQVRMIGTSTDITERKRKEDELAAQKLRSEASEARLRALVEASPLGIAMISPDGDPIFLNPKAEELLGVRFDPAHPIGWTEAVHPEDREKIARSWYEYATVHASESWSEMFRFLHPSGRVVWVSGRAAPMLVAGEMVGFVGTLEDITAFKEAEQALRESEELFRTLGNSIPQLAWMADPDGRVFWFNDRWYEFVGGDAADLKEFDWNAMVHPEHAQRVAEGMGRAFSSGEPWEDTFPICGREGEYRWFLSRMLPIRDEQSRLVRWFGTSTDITERIEAAAERERILERERQARGEAERRAREEAALREAARAVSASETTSEVIRQIAHSAVAATNADGAFVERIERGEDTITIVAAAGEAAAASGTRVPYAGSLAEHVVKSREPLVVQRLADARHQLPGHLVRLRPDDSALVVPLTENGQSIGALILLRSADKLGFRRDEIHRAQTFADLATLAFRKIQMLEESEQRRQELQNVLESRARLMRGFSHDVKNPLGSADGLLSLLEDGIVGDLPTEQRDYVVRARRAIASSLSLIDDLLDLARAEVGQIEIKRLPVDVRETVRELAEEYRVQAESRGLEAEFDVNAEVPVIETDPSRVRQILANLLSNAIKYTDEGRIIVKAELKQEKDGTHPGEWIAISVSDTGIGIPADKQRLLFQEFTRLDPGAKKGAGLGLAISQRIAHALGGEITAKSEAGHGSEFTLWLPCSTSDGADTNLRGDQEGRSGEDERGHAA